MQHTASVLRLSLLSLGALGAIACGSGGAPPMVDAGPIHAVDSGEMPDSPVVAPDAGDGVCGDSLSPTGWAQLPTTCLPLCTHATAVAVDACTTTDCVESALHADTSPAVHVRTQGGYIRDVSCAGSSTAYSCLEWQVYSCFFDDCPDGYNTWVTCLAGGGACTAEQTAMQSCAEANPGWMGCLQPRLRGCYDL